MNLDLLQKIARSNEHQTLFNRAKEISSLRLFRNDSDLSLLQNYYLYFLELYSMLYNDLNSKADFLTEEVIQDTIRVEAYLLLRKETKENEQNKKPKVASGEGSLIFRRKSK